MATDDEIRNAVAVVLDRVDGLRAYAYTPSQFHGPTAVVTEVDVEFDRAMQRGTDRFLVVVRVLAGGDLEAAQKNLSQLIYKLRDAIDADSDLGGVAIDSRVVRKRGNSEGQITVAGATFAVVDIETEVFA